ncbi:hypothetical protein C0J52_05221 [Blattella germanica]|nr:hypothetical protein C0J52_05221 [Blattella germanica]
MLWVVRTSNITSRRRRHLNFPDGSSLQLSFCMQIVSFLRSDMIFSYNIAANWQLPSEVLKLNKHEENEHRRQRRDLYKKLEPILTILGVDGRACILRTLCEASQQRKGNGTFIQEILHAIFKFQWNGPGKEEDEGYDSASRAGPNCTKMFPTCSSSSLLSISSAHQLTLR